MSKENANSTKGSDSSNVLKVSAIVVLLIVTLVVAYRDEVLSSLDSSSSSSKKKSNPLPFPSRTYDLDAVVSKYESRSVPAFVSPISEALGQGKHKIVWGAGYPDGMDDAAFRNLIRRITGLSNGAKNFYASSKTLRKCRGIGTVTAVCLMSHPVVPMDPESPRWERYFDSASIQMLRNPMTAFPAHLNGKHVRYYSGKGQLPLESWRGMRDNHTENMMRKWAESIHAWKNMTRYRVDLYMPVEYLYDPATGPLLVRRLATVLEHVGYPTVLTRLAATAAAGAERDDDPLGTLWYHSVGGKPALEHFQKYGYEYTEYTPGYTAELKAKMIQEVDALIKTYSKDAELKSVLQFYRSEMAKSPVDSA